MEVPGEEEPGLGDSEIIAFNRMTNEQLIANSLVGTYEALDALTSNPLENATFAEGGPLENQLTDPNAQVFFKYLVECALTSSQSVTYTTFDNKTYTASGKHGLCSAWATGDPSSECLQVVAGCLLTRNNLEGHEVRISLRGRNAGGIPLATQTTVPVKTTDANGTMISSFKKCGGSQTGPARDCGFVPASSLVGTCTPSANVTMTCGGTSEFVTRVCDGPNGCDHGSSRNLREGTVCANGVGTFNFSCGPDGAFSAMVGPVSSGTTPEGKTLGGFKSASGGVFPASEKAVWGVEEGTFLGSFLLPDGFATGLGWTRSVDASGVVIFDIPDEPGVDQHP